MGTSTIPAGGGGGLQPRYQKFTSSGTFTLPDGYGVAKPLLVNIQIIGGGGGGSPSSVNWASGATAFAARFNNYFGNNGQGDFKVNASTNVSVAGLNGTGGGSGGVAATQMYLTSSLTITVGAAGTPSATNGAGGVAINSAANSFFNSSPMNVGVAITGTASGSGGTTTAGSVSAAGGNGAAITSASFNFSYTNGQFSDRSSNGNISINAVNAVTSINASSHGNGGTPSGTAGGATPLLGTLAGGSGTDSSIFGSFGIGGKRGDGGTSTGVEGTGGGAGAIGAPGAVILTWWQ